MTEEIPVTETDVAPKITLPRRAIAFVVGGVVLAAASAFVLTKMSKDQTPEETN